MKPKGLLGVLMALLLVVSLFGCSSGGSKEAASEGKIKLTMWYWDRSFNDDLLARVNKQFPNINLVAKKIPGDNYLTKVQTALTSGGAGPDIVAMNSWVRKFIPYSDKFVNLYDYGAEEIETNYLDWKWKQAETKDGKTLIALPLDSGPTALYYRVDLFKKAGLPTDPKAVAEQIQTWEDYLAAGEKIVNATDAKMFDNLGNIFDSVTGQQKKMYFNKSGEFIGDQQHIKKAWDIAVKAQKMGLVAGVDAGSPEWAAMMNNGKIASMVAAVWQEKIIKDSAPDTSGKWRVAYPPGGAGNEGGSFVGILKSSEHPKAAYKVIKWLETPENQLKEYVTMDLWPSTPSVYDDPKMTEKDPFLGGQRGGKVFAHSAKNVTIPYLTPNYNAADTVYGDQLALVAEQNKDPDKAWKDALNKIHRQLKRSQ